MPYKFIPAPEPAVDLALVEAVAKELRDETPADTAGTSSDAPYVVEEQMRHSDRIRVRVIWDRWAHIGPQEWSRIVLEAYGNVRGPSVFLTLTHALGLTHAEAKWLGVEDGVLNAA